MLWYWFDMKCAKLPHPTLYAFRQQKTLTVSINWILFPQVIITACLAAVYALPTTTTTNTTTDPPEDTESITTEALKSDNKRLNIVVVVPPEEGRAFEYENVDYGDDSVEDESMELAETIVFRVPSRHRNQNKRRPQIQRRVDIPYYRRCAPCRPTYPWF